MCCLVLSFQMTTVEWESDFYMLGSFGQLLREDECLTHWARLTRRPLRFHPHTPFTFKRNLVQVIFINESLHSQLIFSFIVVGSLCQHLFVYLESGYGWRDQPETSRRELYPPGNGYPVPFLGCSSGSLNFVRGIGIFSLAVQLRTVKRHSPFKK